MSRIRRVLLATDFSRASRRAFDTALALTDAAGARLTIVSVVAPVMPAVPEAYLDAATVDRLEKQARQWAERQMRTLVDRARRAGATVRGLVRYGDPRSEIVRTARAERTDLLVMGTHGRRGLSKLILGSVAERVIAAAPCPVTTVRGT